MEAQIAALQAEFEVEQEERRVDRADQMRAEVLAGDRVQMASDAVDPGPPKGAPPQPRRPPMSAEAKGTPKAVNPLDQPRRPRMSSACTSRADASLRRHRQPQGDLRGAPGGPVRPRGDRPLPEADAGRGDQIVALPTLVRKLPVPLRKIIGDLSDRERVLVGLDLRPKPWR